MKQIKLYSSLFASKVNYIVNIINPELQEAPRITAIENITNEKSTTINNWLFNKKKPQSTKKLKLADTLGVSYDYLFNDKVPLEGFSKPEVHYNSQDYLVPYVEEKDIFKIKAERIFSIKKRVPVIFPGFEDFIKKYSKNIYITQLSSSSFNPYMANNSLIIYSENVILKNFQFLIYNNAKLNIVSVARLIKKDNKYYLEYTNNKDKFITKQYNETQDFLSILFTINKHTN